MMNEEMEAELRQLDEAGLRRRLRALASAQGPVVRLGEREVVNFSSNDYLGLSQSRELREAMCHAVARFGVGAGASRLICGNLEAHEDLERTLASFKSTEAALAFSSGYATAMGVLPALCGKDDSLILDKLCHASLIDAARLSGATLRVYPHHDLDRLAALLKSTREKSTAGRILVVTESVFSMDGDIAPLREIVDLCEAHDAWLLVDEAHAIGVLGPGGRGWIAELGLEKRVPLQMGTLGKALGVSGGYIAASQGVIDLLINRARSFIFSTAPPPAMAFTAARAIELVQGPQGDALRARLRHHIDVMQSLIPTSPMARGGSGVSTPASAIIPLMVGDESQAMEESGKLLQQGFLIPAIRYPTVARGSARLRLTLSAAHETDQVKRLVACLHHLMPELGSAVKKSLQESAH